MSHIAIMHIIVNCDRIMINFFEGNILYFQEEIIHIIIFVIGKIVDILPLI